MLADMTGAHAISSHQQRVEAAFARVHNAGLEAELLADYSKYLCVLVAGFIEKSFAEMMLEHARRCGSPSLQRYVEQNTSKFTNANCAKIGQLLGAFDPTWRIQIEAYLVDERKAAVDSIYSLRNNIAHGVSVGVTYASVRQYFAKVCDVVSFAKNLVIP